MEFEHDPVVNYKRYEEWTGWAQGDFLDFLNLQLDLDRGRTASPGIESQQEEGEDVPDAATLPAASRNPVPLFVETEAGVELLKSLGVQGEQHEFEQLVEDVQCHAFTLTLLGGFLKRAFNGDIRQSDCVEFHRADPNVQGGHALLAMAAYEQWLLQCGEEECRQVAILRLTGLFDRPADADSIAALCRVSIPELTAPLVGLEQAVWDASLEALEQAGLLRVARDAAGAMLALEIHPLLRDYFSGELGTRYPESWRAGHKLIYEHLCATTDEGEQPGLSELQPLYLAISHGCLAGLQQEVCDKVYRDRILRGTGSEGFYSIHKLGAFVADLGAVACFFDTPWSQVSSAVSEADQAWLLGVAAHTLRALGQLTEAIVPMRAGLEIYLLHNDSENAAIVAGNLSELELTLGKVADAVKHAGLSVSLIDPGGDAFQRVSKRTAHADALHQAGRSSEAEARFREAEDILAGIDPHAPLMTSLSGFRYCELLLDAPARAAWQTMLGRAGVAPSSAAAGGTGTGESPHVQALGAVFRRAAQTLQWIERWGTDILSASLDRLTLGRSAFYSVILGGYSMASYHSVIERAVDGLRRAGAQEFIVRGLLARAWLHKLQQAEPAGGPDTRCASAQADLDEAWEIARRGPMPLLMADILLHRARLFFRETPYLWNNADGSVRCARDDLAAARQLIEEHGYWRRKQELEDAERVIGK